MLCDPGTVGHFQTAELWNWSLALRTDGVPILLHWIYRYFNLIILSIYTSQVIADTSLSIL